MHGLVPGDGLQWRLCCGATATAKTCGRHRPCNSYKHRDKQSHAKAVVFSRAKSWQHAEECKRQSLYRVQARASQRRRSDTGCAENALCGTVSRGTSATTPDVDAAMCGTVSRGTSATSCDYTGCRRSDVRNCLTRHFCDQLRLHRV